MTTDPIGHLYVLVHLDKSAYMHRAYHSHLSGFVMVCHQAGCVRMCVNPHISLLITTHCPKTIKNGLFVRFTTLGF